MDADISRPPQCLCWFARTLERSKLILSVIVLSLITGCSVVPVNNGGDDAVNSPVLSGIPPVQIDRYPAPNTSSVTRDVPTNLAFPVALIVSSEIPSYAGVAARLYELVSPEELTTWIIEDPTNNLPAGADRLTKIIESNEPKTVVAVGLSAALFALRNLDVPTIICQVFNHVEYPELENAIATVSVLPSFDEQLQFWRSIDSNLSSVGAIVGPGHDVLIDSSQRSADDQQIAFSYRVSQSDQETVYQFKRLANEIDGFWLLPDNRILSLTAIEELMAYADSRDIPVVVSNPGLLRFGALMSLAPSPSQVADRVYSLLSESRELNSPILGLVESDRFDVEINPAVATRYGIRVD